LEALRHQVLEDLPAEALLHKPHLLRNLLGLLQVLG